MKIEGTSAASNFSTTEIEAALERVLVSNQFVRSKRLGRFLSYIVQQALSGNQDKLAGYAIGLDVFDRPEDFDPAIDTIVRVEARRLRQSLQTYYFEDGKNDPLEITVPKGSYVPVFAKRTTKLETVAVTAPAAAKQHRRGPVIAVLPFDNYSPDPTENFFANGLTEQLIASLARFRDLSVISRHSVSNFRGEKFDLNTLRDKLGADYFFEGSIRKTQKNVRVTAQFIYAPEDVHLWADTFEQALTADDLFDIQDNIAETMAARIADRYGPLGRVGGAGSSSRTSSFDAYAAVLKFYDNYANHDPNMHREAWHGLEQAIATDPDYADAHAALAAIFLDEYRFGFNALDTDMSALNRAMAAANKALRLDAENIMGHQFLACSHFHAGDNVAFRVVAERALELNPGHADALADLGTCYWMIGDTETGERLVSRAMELSPTRPSWYHTVAMATAILAGEYEEALRETHRFFMPGFLWSYAWRAAVLGRLEKRDAAQNDLAELEKLYPDFGRHYYTEARKWRCSDALIESVAEGLRMAGLDIRNTEVPPPDC